MDTPTHKLRILMICKSLPDSFKGGIQTHVWALSKWLGNRGHEVTLLAGGPFRKKQYTEQLDDRKVIRIPFIPGRRLPLLRLTIEELAFSLAAYRWIKKHEDQYDIIHIQGRSGAWIPAGLNNKVVVTYHGLIEMENGGPIPFSFRHLDKWAHAKAARWLESLPTRNAKAIIFVSKSLKQKFIELHGSHLPQDRVIPNGVQVDQLPPSLQSSAHQLVFVGRLHPIKGLIPLFKALPMIDPAIKLVLVGDGPLKSQLVSLADELGIADRIEMRGSLSHQVAMQIIKESFALVLPSFYETQGIVLMEANIQGLPVIASDIDGINEVVEDGLNGLLVKPGNSAALAFAINSLYHNPAWAKELGDNGRQRVYEKYDWQQIAADTEAFYASTVLKSYLTLV